MPLLSLQTSAPLNEARVSQLLPALSAIMTQVTGKPEKYVMITIGPCAALMAGTAEPAAFIDVRGIGGLTGLVNAQLSKAISTQLLETLSIPADRIYLTFTDIPAKNWGWNNGTFG